jgi:signal transduction histidine kinase
MVTQQRNTQRLINLVNQLLDLSRFEAGKMVARFRGTDVSKMTANLAALFRSAMHKVSHFPSTTPWIGITFNLESDFRINSTLSSTVPILLVASGSITTSSRKVSQAHLMSVAEPAFKKMLRF